jgi:hypothetical protein
MDMLEAKNRVAEAFVESIFRRARYQIARFRRDGSPGLRIGREDFSPSFSMRFRAEDGEREYLVEVKYHPHIEQFLSMESQRADRSVFRMARRQWPDLYFILVSERPEPGRSSFQVVPLSTYLPTAPCRSVDLADLKELGIFPQNVLEHEELIRRVFALLSGV